ncbi:MAG: UbiX family flavin prenyltransferase [Desulfobacterales bacterium]|jgi:4-hydroxy-3-polyprenylbenzoate decarboxylase|nr:UbiX family flavin prenyltransferase [Desulfobacterales bacterium]
MNQKKIVVAICGASGAIYGIRLLAALMNMPMSVYLMISPSGRAVLAHESGFSHPSMAVFLKEHNCQTHEDAHLYEFDTDDFFAPFASGSFRHDGMVVAPCSMNTLAAMASGVTHNLIHRAGDVCLKEKRPLILVPRETPLNRIHLENMMRLADAGAVILPAMPGFYHNPQTIEDLVDSVLTRVLDHLGIDHPLSPRWGDTDTPK